MRDFYEGLGYEVNEESEFDGVPYYDMSRRPYGESDESIGVKTSEQLGKEWEEENIKTFDKDAPEYKKPSTALSESIEEMEEKYSARTNKDKTIFKRTKITQRMQNQAAKNKQELLQKIEQLNKLAMSLGVHREAKKMKE